MATQPRVVGAPCLLAFVACVLGRFVRAHELVGHGVEGASEKAHLVRAAVRRTQPPFSANVVAQAAALESLRHRDRLRERVLRNDAERRQLSDGLTQRGITHAASQTNFVLMRTEEDPAEVVDGLLREGVIVRQLGPDVRVTVGTTDENTLFLKALDGLGVGA